MNYLIKFCAAAIISGFVAPVVMAEPPIDDGFKQVTVTPDMIWFAARDNGLPPIMIVKDETQSAYLIENMLDFSCFDMGVPTTIVAEKQYIEAKRFNWVVVETPFCDVVITEPAQ